jgi:hypothetical protein
MGPSFLSTREDWCTMRRIVPVGLSALIVGIGLALVFPRTNERPSPGPAEDLAPRHATSAPKRTARSNKLTPPPAFSTLPTESGKFRIDPTSPDYDPVRASLPAGGLHKLFALEPRDPTWAPAVESALAPLMTGDLKRATPGVTGLSVECRATMCLVSWHGPPDQENAAKQVLSTVFSGAIEKHGRNNILIAYAGGEFYAELKGRPVELIEKLKAAREVRLQALRSGRAPQQYYSKLPSELWK